MEFKEFTAANVDEAITRAQMEFGVTSDRLEFEVIQEASKGFLGIGSRSAIIKARPRIEEELKKEQEIIEREEKKDAAMMSGVMEFPKPEEKKIITSDEIEKRAAMAAARAKDLPPLPEEKKEKRPERGRRRHEKPERAGRNDRRKPRMESLPAGTKEVEEKPHKPSQPKPERVVTPRSEEEVEAIKNTAVTFLTNVFASMNMEVKMTLSYDQKEGSLGVTFDGDDMGILIGKRGQTLDSLQYLTSLVVNKDQNEYIRVKLDTEDYRARRADTLENLARNIAYKVKKGRRAVALEPMNPYERRIIHSSLQGNKFVETYSEGEEPYRHVVVAPKH